MKRIFLIMTVMLLGLGVANADNPLRIKSGSLLCLKETSQRISYEFDFSKAKGGGQPLKEYLKTMGMTMQEFQAALPEMRKFFAEKWDDNIRRGAKISESEDAPYHMVIVVKNLQLGSQSATRWSMFGGATISGKVLFYDDSDNEGTFCEVEVLKQQGTVSGASMAGTLGLCWVFNDLAENLCNLVRRSK